MKIQKFKYIFCVFTITILGFSCSDQMDYNENTGYNINQIFESFDRTKGFVTNIYSKLDYDFGQYGGAMQASACDEADYAWTNSEIHDFYSGAWSPINPKSSVWGNSYDAIRAVNLYLRESKDQTFESFKFNKDYEDQMKRFNNYQYEVRLIRAYAYFNLVRQYGDVPFTIEVLTDDEVNKLSRTSYNEIFDFIVNECDELSTKLPSKYTFENEIGRINHLVPLA